MPPLRATRITLPETIRVRSVALLQHGLVQALDLERQALDAAARHGDAVTSDLFTEVSRAVDQRLWMVQAQRER